MAELNITIETVLNDAFSQMARTIYQKFGVRVQDVSFEWSEIDSIGPADSMILKDVTIWMVKDELQDVESPR